MYVSAIDFCTASYMMIHISTTTSYMREGCIIRAVTNNQLIN